MKLEIYAKMISNDSITIHTIQTHAIIDAGKKVEAFCSVPQCLEQCNHVFYVRLCKLSVFLNCKQSIS